MSAILEFIGIEDLVGFDLVFGISALVGGLLFLLWFVLLMVGGAASDLFDGLFDIQIGDTDLYLIETSASFSRTRAYIYGNHHWVVKKLNDEYDMSNFTYDFKTYCGLKEDFDLVKEFHKKDISNIKKRKEFIERNF